MGMKKKTASPLELSRNLETYKNVKYLLKKKINQKKINVPIQKLSHKCQLHTLFQVRGFYIPNDY